MLSDLPSGVAVTRLGDKATMLGGCFVVALSCLGFALSPDPWTLGLLGLLFGAGFGALMLGRLHYVARHCPAAYRGRAITALGGIQRVGLFVGPAAGGLVAEAFGFAFAFIGSAALILAGLGLIAIFVRRATPGTHAGAQPPLPTIARIVRTHRGVFARAGLATVALQFVRSARQLLIPLWGEAIGLDAASIGLAFGFSSALDAAMFYPAGRLMDFRGRKWSLVPSLAVHGASLALLPLTASFWPYLAVTLLSGLANGLGTGIIMALGADLSPRVHRGSSWGSGDWWATRATPSALSSSVRRPARSPSAAPWDSRPWWASRGPPGRRSSCRRRCAARHREDRPGLPGFETNATSQEMDGGRGGVKAADPDDSGVAVTHRGADRHGCGARRSGRPSPPPGSCPRARSRDAGSPRGG